MPSPSDPALAKEYALALLERASQALEDPKLTTHNAYFWKTEIVRARRIFHGGR